jgi:hypothetical protein
MFALKKFEILAFGTMRNSRIAGCTLKTDERLKKERMAIGLREGEM